MTIKFLQASYGDCIHIESDGHHAIIDGGPHAEPLLTELNVIKEKGECIDLLVVTHYDNDHIVGVLEALSRLPGIELKDFVKEVWFNAPKGFKADTERQLGALQGNKLGNLLVANGVNWIIDLRQGQIFNLSETASIEVLYQGGCDSAHKGGESLGNTKCDWETSFEDLKPFINDRALDKSAVNSESIILLAKSGDHKILLPGDSTPDKILATLKNYNGGVPTHYNLVKLPHHGSYKNITKDILDQIVCNHYVVSTDGSSYFHPNKKALLKILEWGHTEDMKPFIFSFNYPKLIDKLKITPEEKACCHFDCDGRSEFEF